MNEFSSRVSSGIFQVEEYCYRTMIGSRISHFPRKGDYVFQKITRGIAVRVSMLRMYDYYSPWAYSISMRLLIEGEPGYLSPEERGFNFAQLKSRHYRIEKIQGTPDVVDGDAVIGYHPVLGER